MATKENYINLIPLYLSVCLGKHIEYRDTHIKVGEKTMVCDAVSASSEWLVPIKGKDGSPTGISVCGDIDYYAIIWPAISRKKENIAIFDSAKLRAAIKKQSPSFIKHKGTTCIVLTNNIIDDCSVLFDRLDTE